MQQHICRGVVLIAITGVVATTPATVEAQTVLRLDGLGSAVGVSVRETSTEEAGRAGTSGAAVVAVRAGTPAARAGVQEGDLVVEFDGERVRSARQLSRLVRETAPGRTVTMAVVRGDMRQTLQVTPEARGPADLGVPPDVTARVERGLRQIPRAFDFDFDFAWPDGPGSSRRLGVTVAPLSPQLADYFGVSRGVLVTDVAMGSAAAAAGFRAGDVITMIDGRGVSTASDITSALRQAEAGSSVEVRVTRERREVTLTPTVPERRPVRTAGQPV